MQAIYIIEFLQSEALSTGSSLTQSKISFLISTKEDKPIDKISEKSPALRASITLGRFSLSFLLSNAHDANFSTFCSKSQATKANKNNNSKDLILIIWNIFKKLIYIKMKKN